MQFLKLGLLLSTLFAALVSVAAEEQTENVFGVSFGIVYFFL
jgi:hypothetical protein